LGRAPVLGLDLKDLGFDFLVALAMFCFMLRHARL
jgi:hypothetical protein